MGGQYDTVSTAKNTTQANKNTGMTSTSLYDFVCKDAVKSL